MENVNIDVHNMYFAINQRHFHPYFTFVPCFEVVNLVTLAPTHLLSVLHVFKVDCYISGCKPGYAGTTTCTQCPINTYSPGHLEECISCGELSETEGPGTSSITDCSELLTEV